MSFDFGNMNPEQVEAVKHINGPCRVIAGAGSGKTRVDKSSYKPYRLPYNRMWNKP